MSGSKDARNGEFFADLGCVLFAGLGAGTGAIAGYPLGIWWGGEAAGGNGSLLLAYVGVGLVAGPLGLATMTFDKSERTARVGGSITAMAGPIVFYELSQKRALEPGDAASAIYVVYNGWSGSVNFSLPWPGTGKSWYRVTDTCSWAERSNQVNSPGSESFIGGEGYVYGVCSRSMMLITKYAAEDRWLIRGARCR